MITGWHAGAYVMACSPRAFTDLLQLKINANIMHKSGVPKSTYYI